ncbi:PREDICTED: probable pectinesterase/pectinesterase inhibitor 21, partial [Camelina sativa]|uniref:Probable pectinesterase/pectinesterase inhibitor 21 n=1 Tax=Camelina sativa TaxID=90675 RepID=A0ABM0XR70_CAMSA
MSYGYNDDSKRKKRFIVITISSVLLISMVVAVTVGVSLNKGGDDSDGNGEITSSVKAVKDVCAPTDYKKTCEDTLIKNGNNTSDPIELVKTAFKATMKQITDAAKKSQTMMELQKDKALKTAIELTHNGLAIISELSNFVGQMQIPSLNSRRLLSEGIPSWVDQRGRKLLQAAAAYSDAKADIVVAQDGSGQYTTINEALKFVPKKKNTTFVVHIKAGIYNEYVQVNKSMTHLVFIGDGPDKTIISGNKSYKDGITTYRTCTVAIVGDYFIAKNIGFENTAGAIKHQAVALRVQSDEAIFFNCRFDGYQDTLYTHSHRQFFRDCTISGTIDFLFGDSAAVF